jgi:hypothetical protein
MLVSELIGKLQNLPLNMRVLVEHERYGFIDVSDVELAPVHLDYARHSLHAATYEIDYRDEEKLEPTLCLILERELITLT